MVAFGGVVFGVDAFEVEGLVDAGDEDEEGFEGEDCPEEVEVGGDDEVVAPGVGKEGAGEALESPGGPEAVHVGSADDAGGYHECDADE